MNRSRSAAISIVMIGLVAACSGTKQQHKSILLPGEVVSFQPDAGANTCSESGCPIPDRHATQTSTMDADPAYKKPNVASHCPDGMVEVEGDYCPVVQEICLYWVGIDGQRIPPSPKFPGRCGEWKYPTKCLSKTLVYKHFCIDKYEYPNVEGQKPQSWMSWNAMKKIAGPLGKRLCTASEWTMSCEGPTIKPYPYGDGYHRDKTACNFDNHLGNFDVFSCVPRPGAHGLTIPPEDAPCRKYLNSFVVPSGSMPRCVSDYGVYDQVANLDEPVVNETGRPYRSNLAGGHMFGVRNNCRQETEAHSEGFQWYEVGGRLCSNIK